MTRRIPQLVAIVAIAGAIAWQTAGQAASANSTQTVDGQGRVVTATYQGQQIDPAIASHYFCHTRDYPVVRCFDSQAEVDADLGWIEPTEPGQAAEGTDSGGDPTSPDWGGGPYTIAYWDINYGGSALTVYTAVSDLGLLGWDNNISSIKSVNCGIPRYFVNTGYGGGYWQNACNVWSPNLYSTNDTFSSVENMAP